VRFGAEIIYKHVICLWTITGKRTVTNMAATDKFCSRKKVIKNCKLMIWKG
jgi:hypothetical protein